MSSKCVCAWHACAIGSQLQPLFAHCCQMPIHHHISSFATIFIVLVQVAENLSKKVVLYYLQEHAAPSTSICHPFGHLCGQLLANGIDDLDRHTNKGNTIGHITFRLKRKALGPVMTNMLMHREVQSELLSL